MEEFSVIICKFVINNPRSDFDISKFVLGDWVPPVNNGTVIVYDGNEVVESSPQPGTAAEPQPESSSPNAVQPASEPEVPRVDDPPKCSVCLSNSYDCSSPCGHFFHRLCIVPWITEHFSCPMCLEPLAASLLRSVEQA